MDDTLSPPGRLGSVRTRHFRGLARPAPAAPGCGPPPPPPERTGAVAAFATPLIFALRALCVFYMRLTSPWPGVKSGAVISPRKTRDLRQLHRALIDLASVMNRPQRDEALIKEAGIVLDRALFPLLVGVERLGPISVGELADRVGRDHTTVSRQVAKLERLGLVARRPSPADGRFNQAQITPGGREMAEAVDSARARQAAPILARWSEQDLADLVRLMRRFADDLMTLPGAVDDR